ncbi:hypothetical protein A7U60_g1743 [Sanghuangporus baumii]|uniref:Uncharacterized protein n=1 Tax=Sanghuangporus baumii TaxID=108892 RepID=A0A9Q5I3R4_SANBA|nr:hypothetical protein A7U60_g1743 [Sanghuangporus baumii]
MASTTHESHTMNTPQPYGGSELGTQGHATSKADIDTSPSPSTHGPGAVAGGTSRTDLASGQNEAKDQGSGIQGGRKDTNGVAEPAEEEGGAARGSGTKAAEGEQAPPKDSGAPEGGYPEQLHAGKLDGLGPEYGKTHRVTLGDRLQGVKEEIKGSVKRDPELKKTGKERMTGELKRKQLEKDSNPDPLQNADDKKDDKNEEQSEPKKTRTETTDEPGLMEHPQAHPTEKGREEQAGSVHPEGTGSLGTQQRAKENTSSGE